LSIITDTVIISGGRTSPASVGERQQQLSSQHRGGGPPQNRGQRGSSERGPALTGTTMSRQRPAGKGAGHGNEGGSAARAHGLRGGGSGDCQLTSTAAVEFGADRRGDRCGRPADEMTEFAGGGGEFAAGDGVFGVGEDREHRLVVDLGPIRCRLGRGGGELPLRPRQHRSVLGMEPYSISQHCQLHLAHYRGSRFEFRVCAEYQGIVLTAYCSPWANGYA
jgi:hypothetical protein